VPAAQSVSLPQVARQALTPLQKYGAHDSVGLTHVPPAQVPAIVSVAALAGQVAAEQGVPSV
jgi:hypothetical protein